MKVVLSLISIDEYSEAKKVLDSTSEAEGRDLLEWIINSALDISTESLEIGKIQNSPFLRDLKLIQIGEKSQLVKYKNDSISFNSYRMLYENAKLQNDSILIKFSLTKLLKLICSNPKLPGKLSDYLEVYRPYISQPLDSTIYDYYNVTLDAYKNQKSYLSRLDRALNRIKNNHTYNSLRARLYQMKGIQAGHFDKNYELAIYSYNKALLFYRKTDTNRLNSNLFGVYNNLGVTYSDMGEFDKAQVQFELAEAHASKLRNTEQQAKNYYALAVFNSNKEDWKTAYFYATLERELREQLNFEKIAIELSELDIKYKSAEKDRIMLQDKNKILVQEKENTRRRNINYTLGASSGLIALIGFLLFKNTKRKQRIAEQEREIEIQKTEKLLKEQELTAIDAMIAGQEKERQRLANDLHDSVGVTLSAAHMQFQYLSDNRDQLEALDELFQKTGVLLEDAYKEVRSMAHAKNSGVIAKKGLLPAVLRLAKTVSTANNLQVEVRDFGLENRLDNHLEITIFRIIQELITNIIKHAQASEAHISITQHEDALSIIVEDNGKGFNARKLPKKEGMGLSSIETRVEHMDGSMEVDSSPGKGTSVLIDIPL